MMFTWNAADYLSSDHPLYFGRPNTWGQLHSNLVLQQCDLLISVGARLGLQATGFAWEDFVPIGKVVQVDVDDDELRSEHPKKALTIKADAMVFLSELLRLEPKKDWREWVAFSVTVKALCPKPSALSSRDSSYIQPQSLMEKFGRLIPRNAQITPSSSGGAFTVSMQCLELSSEMRLISKKGLASMGYGLSGAIGMAIANPELPTICVEGDGGFAQNIQELGTVAKNHLNLKIFVFANGGYASIRMTQRNYFDGAWVGCDSSTGLGLPDLRLLADSFGLEYMKLDAQLWETQVREAFTNSGPLLIEVPIDPEQTYLPKIGSKVAANGAMVSNPLHRMTPALADDVRHVVERFLIQKGISCTRPNRK
jgi:acetolactate synthase-1/2/3 large subunit